MQIEELKKYIEEIQPEYKYKKVILFGSRARGDNREDSDIDLLVEFDKNHNTLFIMANMINKIQDKFNLEVDIISYPIIRTIAGLELRIDKEILLYG